MDLYFDLPYQRRKVINSQDLSRNKKYNAQYPNGVAKVLSVKVNPVDREDQDIRTITCIK